MSEAAVNVTTALSRAAYGDMEDVAEFLASLDDDSLFVCAVGLAVIGNAWMETLASLSEKDPDVLRDTWLAELTDSARSP